MLRFLLHSFCTEFCDRKSWCVSHTEGEGSYSPWWESTRTVWKPCMKICLSPPIIHLVSHFHLSVWYHVYLFYPLGHDPAHLCWSDHPGSGTWGHVNWLLCADVVPPTMWSFGCWLFCFKHFVAFYHQKMLWAPFVFPSIVYKSHKTGFIFIIYIHHDVKQKQKTSLNHSSEGLPVNY